MLILIAFAVGLAGAWIYAGCPLPERLVRAVRARPAVVRSSVPPAAGDRLNPAPERGASPAGP